MTTNHAAYDAAMDTARLLGGNFKLVRDRKRELARDLVKASVVEGFALAEAIKDAKGKMRWTRLASDEQNQMNVLFTAVRLIDGAWKALPKDKRKAFLAGELVFSTLAKDIKAAEKAALEAEAEAEDQAEAEEQAEQASPPEPEPEAEVDIVAEAQRYSVAQLVQMARHALNCASKAEVAEAREFMPELLEAILRHGQAEVPAKAKAA